MYIKIFNYTNEFVCSFSVLSIALRRMQAEMIYFGLGVSGFGIYSFKKVPWKKFNLFWNCFHPLTLFMHNWIAGTVNHSYAWIYFPFKNSQRWSNVVIAVPLILTCLQLLLQSSHLFFFIFWKHLILKSLKGCDEIL